jgi:hypothetical protein
MEDDTSSPEATTVEVTVLAVTTPLPPELRVERPPRDRNTAEHIANLILDSVDDVADAVAAALGLRGR